MGGGKHFTLSITWRNQSSEYLRDCARDVFFHLWFCCSHQALACLNSVKLQTLPTTPWQDALPSINYLRCNYRTNQRNYTEFKPFYSWDFMFDILRLGTSTFTERVLQRCCWLHFALKQNWRESFWKQKFITSWCITYQHCQVLRYGQTSCYPCESYEHQPDAHRAVFQWELRKTKIKDKTLLITISLWKVTISVWKVRTIINMHETEKASIPGMLSNIFWRRY